MLKILKDKENEKELRMLSKKINTPLLTEDEDLANKMLTYIKKSQDKEYARKHNIRAGIGLSANQIGVLKRIFVIYLIEDNKTHIYALANPKIIAHSIAKAYLSYGEGCLSVDEDRDGYVHRHKKITLEAYDILNKKKVKIKAKNELAIVMQHELDHLNGILYYDHIDKEDPFKIISNSTAI